MVIIDDYIYEHAIKLDGDYGLKNKIFVLLKNYIYIYHTN